MLGEVKGHQLRQEGCWKPEISNALTGMTLDVLYLVLVRHTGTRSPVWTFHVTMLRRCLSVYPLSELVALVTRRFLRVFHSLGTWNSGIKLGQ